MFKGKPDPIPGAPTPAPRPKLPPRLVVFGTRTVTSEGRYGRHHETEYESAYDVSHPCDVYYRQVGTTEWHRKDPESTVPNNKVEDSFVMRRREHTPTSGAADPDVHTPLPDPTPEERAVAQAIVGKHKPVRW